ncbi:MAG: LamG domain-containing protein [bacterium]|nr:LamG domain-containing protein [bacterium]
MTELWTEEFFSTTNHDCPMPAYLLPKALLQPSIFPKVISEPHRGIAGQLFLPPIGRKILILTDEKNWKPLAKKTLSPYGLDFVSAGKAKKLGDETYTYRAIPIDIVSKRVLKNVPQKGREFDKIRPFVEETFSLRDLKRADSYCIEFWMNSDADNTHELGFTESRPPMPAVIGPLAVYVRNDRELMINIYKHKEKYYFQSTPDKWYHIALQVTAGKMEIFVNGFKVSSEKKVPTLRSSSVCLGKGYGNRLWSGLISTARIEKAVVYTAPFMPSPTIGKTEDTLYYWICTDAVSNPSL